MKAIVFLPLSQGKFAMIDSDDFEKVGRVKWSAQKEGKNFYAYRMMGGGRNRKIVYLHGAILEIKGVDHRNGNGLDCRRENIRPATAKQQSQAFQRKRPGTSSKFRGVTWHRSASAWQAKISAEGSSFYLGLFKEEIDAARAYDVKAKELGFFKEALNFP